MRRVYLPGWILAVALLYTQAPAAAQDPQYQAKGDQKRTYSFPGTGESIPYRLYVPSKWNENTKLPLVVVLHGANQNPDTPFERGDGILPKVAEQHGYIVASVLGYRPNGGYNNPFPLVPAPVSERVPPAGGERKGKGKAPAPLVTAEGRERSEMDVLYVADLVAKEYNADPSRVYLMGNSMGGGGTWFLGEKYPERWAAISPSAGPIGAAVDFPYDRLKGVPILVVHGDHDHVTSYDASVAQVQRAKEHGLEVEFIPVRDGEHFTAWTFVVPQIFDFFDKHRKKT